MADLVFTIDCDVKRRAAISYYLNNNGFFAEPFENTSDFLESVPRDGYALVYDDGTTLASLLPEIARRDKSVPVVAYSNNPDPERIVEAVLNGALGYLAWSGCCASLIRAIRDTDRRQAAPISISARRLIAVDRIETLTAREAEILVGMANGLSSRQMSVGLELSPRTVEYHRANMLAKIGAKSSAEAIRMAIESSLTPIYKGPLRKAA